jgi:hypothetical protein
MNITVNLTITGLDGAIIGKLDMIERPVLEVLERMQHVLSGLVENFDVTIVPVAHRDLPTEPPP